MTTPIDADLLMAFIKSEAEERMTAMKPTDDPRVVCGDLAYIEGLEVIAQYVLVATGRDRCVPLCAHTLADAIAERLPA